MGTADPGRVICPVCGPQEPPIVHTHCHPHPPLRYQGCGHPLSKHTDGLRCRTCGAECGIDSRPAMQASPALTRPNATREEPPGSPTLF